MQVMIAKPKSRLSVVLDYFTQHKYYLILFLCLTLGMLLGALSVKFVDAEYKVIIARWVSTFLRSRAESTFWRMFFNCYLISFASVVFICILGFGVVGLPLQPILLFLRGFGTCALAGQLYSEYSLQGIAYANLILLPFCVTLDFLLLYLSSFSMEISKQFWSILTGGYDKIKSIKSNGIQLLRRSLYISLCFVIVALLEAAFTVFFIKYFKFN